MNQIDVLALDGKLLKTFLAVYEAKSVTQAAKHLGVSQSAVSHSLDRLRQYIGDPLFVKSGRGITPTSVATAIAPKISKIIGDIEALTLHTQYRPDHDTAPFTIATNVTELLPALLEIKSVMDHVAHSIPLRFIELGARSNALSVLNESQADIAITASIGAYPLELSTERFYQDEIVCFYDPSQREAPVTMEEYCAARHAVLDFGGNAKSIVDASLDNAGQLRHIALAASNSFALANFTIGTDLIATLPKRLQLTAFKAFELCQPPFPLPMVSYDLVWHRRETESSRHQWFRKLLTRTLFEFELNAARG